MPSAKQAALKLASLGLAVHPCRSKDKRPATRNGCLDASTDQDKIREAFKPEHNIGIATGPASGIWVLDLDGPEGIEAFDKWKVGQEMPKTATVKTGRGRHYYFKLNGVPINNRTKIGGDSIDVRGEGGYVIAPPSKHENGSVYIWEHGPEHLAEAPDWLYEKISSGPSRQTSPLGNVTIAPSFQLALHGGANEGNRHDTLCRLVGGEVARGILPATIKNEAIVWGDRCNPPMPPSEAVQIANDILTRQEVSDLEVPLPPAKQFPVLSDAAFLPPLGEIIKELEQETEADVSNLIITALVYFGNLVGRGPYFQVGGTKHRCNLFTVICGATASGRKGTGADLVQALFESVNRDWLFDQVHSGGLSSGEGLIFQLRDEVTDRRLLFLESEFVNTLRVLKREKNTLGGVLKNAWDGKTLRNTTKATPLIARDPHCSLVGHVTAEELRATMSANEIFGGLANRCLWVLSQKTKSLPEGGTLPCLESFTKPLSFAAAAAQDIEQMQRTPEAKEVWASIYNDLDNRQRHGVFGAVCSRAQANCLRLSMIYALLDGSEWISPEHVEAAAAVWDYCEASARYIFEDNTPKTLSDRLLANIRQHPGVSRSELRQLVGRGINPERVAEALATLRDQGLARNEELKTKGRPSETWHPNK